jgi:hypothetical protein
VGVGALGVLAAGCLVIVGGGIYLVTREIDVARADESAARREFDAVRERFVAQEPLITIGPGGEATASALEQWGAAYTGPPPERLHVLAWDPNERRLARFALPFWLLRFGNVTPRLKVNDFDLARLGIDIDDIQRAGPALLVDHSHGEGRVLIWSE